ncbi:extracellular matrix/biofilm biosynthesis regulator RemA family protein [Gracilibacillus sp. JCM 18860]
MLQELRREKEIIATEEDLTKAIVITTNKVYYSPLSVLTLKKRASMISTISKLEDYSENYEES